MGFPLTNSHCNESVSQRLQAFFESTHECFKGEWNNGLNDDDWELLKEVQTILTKGET